jgi:hypothetical protein
LLLQLWRNIEDEQLQAELQQLFQRRSSLHAILSKTQLNLEHFTEKIHENPSSEVNIEAFPSVLLIGRFQSPVIAIHSHMQRST